MFTGSFIQHTRWTGAKLIGKGSKHNEIVVYIFSNSYPFLLFTFLFWHRTAPAFTDGFLDMACLRGVENACMKDGIYLHRCLQHTKGDDRKGNHEANELYFYVKENIRRSGRCVCVCGTD